MAAETPGTDPGGTGDGGGGMVTADGGTDTHPAAARTAASRTASRAITRRPP
jgi:hypothetical protein